MRPLAPLASIGNLPSGWTASVRVAGLPSLLLPPHPTRKEVSDRVRASPRSSRRPPQRPGPDHRRHRDASTTLAGSKGERPPLRLAELSGQTRLTPWPTPALGSARR